MPIRHAPHPYGERPGTHAPSRLWPFAKPTGNDRYLREADGRSRPNRTLPIRTNGRCGWGTADLRSGLAPAGPGSAGVKVRANTIIRRRKLYEEVMKGREEMIQDGQFGLGDFLPSERELMQHFGVGRPAVREALFALQRMGLVVVATGERPRVSTPTPKTLLSELAGSARLLLSKPDGTRYFQRARALFECGTRRRGGEDRDRGRSSRVEGGARPQRGGSWRPYPIRAQRRPVPFC